MKSDQVKSPPAKDMSTTASHPSVLENHPFAFLPTILRLLQDEQQHNNQRRCDQSIENGGIEKGLDRADRLHEVEQVAHDNHQSYCGVESLCTTESALETVSPSCGFCHRISGRTGQGRNSHQSNTQDNAL